MRVFSRKFIQTMIAMIVTIIVLMFPSLDARAEGKKTVIVIDPGHGGENLGADYLRGDGKSFVEKDMTLITALSMKEELEKYDNVEVYLTRETDVEKDISLKNRVKLAQDIHADFFISLHYNMSVTHILYGAEVWVPSVGELYSKGASLATEFMKEFDEKDLFHRGIKTRLNDKGTDYYGILRNAAEMNVPAILVEHCHLDNARDYERYETEEKLKEFGISDARAVAKYFGLASSQEGMDYRTYEKTEIPIPTGVVAPDITNPDDCKVSLLDYDTKTGKICIEIEAFDYDTDIFYYTYSYDNGTTWNPLLEWGEGTSVTADFTVEDGTVPRIYAKVYNAFDLSTESTLLELPAFEKEPESMEESLSAESEDELFVQEEAWKATQSERVQRVLLVCLLSMSILLAALITFRIITKKRNRRRRRHK